MENIFKGLITALITPLENGKLDIANLEKLIELQIQNGIKALVIGGATGEGPALLIEEYTQLIHEATRIAAGRIKIIACLFSSNTEISKLQAQIAIEAKANGLMVTLPPYNKPTQEGLFQHCKAIHDVATIPIMLYTSIGRSAVEISNETILRASSLERIKALKYSGNDLERILNLSKMLKDKFNFLTGDDSIALGFNAQGGKGVVSVASNITPGLSLEIQEEWNKGNLEHALFIHQRLSTLYEALFHESNPIPVKYAAYKLGLCNNELKLPLTPASKNTMAKIDLALKELGIL